MEEDKHEHEHKQEDNDEAVEDESEIEDNGTLPITFESEAPPQPIILLSQARSNQNTVLMYQSKKAREISVCVCRSFRKT